MLKENMLALKTFLLSTAILLWCSVPGFAKDKDHIELTCGTTKATITCTKFQDVDGKEGICVASELVFDTADSKHVVPPDLHDIPQYFKVPTIATSLSCRLNPDKVTMFAVGYSPYCTSSKCVSLKVFSLDGNQISYGGIILKKYWTNGKPTFVPVPATTLREDQ